ncbi:hypothetical protein R1flu_028363 [Riccia fluitans]|uniref:Uncharacterized protein n=1 Tax=Riccia fluitans TaxID=41844 RepID=A0ABD1XM07_9MARC
MKVSPRIPATGSRHEWSGRVGKKDTAAVMLRWCQGRREGGGHTERVEEKGEEIEAADLEIVYSFTTSSFVLLTYNQSPGLIVIFPTSPHSVPETVCQLGPFRSGRLRYFEAWNHGCHACRRVFNTNEVRPSD